MSAIEATRQCLAAIPGLRVNEDEPLAQHTRFGIGGPARLFAESAAREPFLEALRIVFDTGVPWTLIGGGTNLVVSDQGFDGVVLRYTGGAISGEGPLVQVEAGAVLQDLVDQSIARGLSGLHTMTGIPGGVGGAIYGNAGAYGHSIQESVARVWFFDGTALRSLTNAQCEFRYRESIFKAEKNWIIIAAELEMPCGDAATLKAEADAILDLRNRKYPPEMKCAGSIFKNLLLRDLAPAVREQIPSQVIREGKVPSAWFLEQVGGKGMRDGDIHVADYHANLIYNAGSGSARQVRAMIAELKKRVNQRFGIELEEEVQYVGFTQASRQAGQPVSLKTSV